MTREVAGTYEHILKFFKKSIENNNLSHAYIVDGGDKSLRDIVVKEISYLLFCKTQNKCMLCNACIQISAGTLSDITDIRIGEGEGLGVKDIRERLCNDVYTKPFLSKYKLYIIHEADLLNVESQNAILKTLEEPPEYIIIFLLCDNCEILTDTIRSRCSILRLRLIKKESIRKIVSGITSDNIDEIVDLSRGMAGLAIRLAQNNEEFNRYKEYIEIISKSKSNDYKEVLSITDKIISIFENEDFYREFLGVVRTFLRDELLLLHKADINDLEFISYTDKLKSFMKNESFRTVSKKLELIDRIENSLHYNVNANIAATLFVQGLSQNE